MNISINTVQWFFETLTELMQCSGMTVRSFRHRLFHFCRYIIILYNFLIIYFFNDIFKWFNLGSLSCSRYLEGLCQYYAGMNLFASSLNIHLPTSDIIRDFPRSASVYARLSICLRSTDCCTQFIFTGYFFQLLHNIFYAFFMQEYEYTLLFMIIIL